MGRTLESVVGVNVHVVCWVCHGKRVVQHERRPGETLRCPICNGTGSTPHLVTLSELRELLKVPPYHACPSGSGSFYVVEDEAGQPRMRGGPRIAFCPWCGGGLTGRAPAASSADGTLADFSLSGPAAAAAPLPARDNSPAAVTTPLAARPLVLHLRPGTPSELIAELVAAAKSALPAGLTCVRITSHLGDDCAQAFGESRCPQCRITAVTWRMQDAEPVSPANSLVLPLRPGRPSEMLSCLLCREPHQDGPGTPMVGGPSCEYETTYQRVDGQTTVGVHEACARRSGLLGPVAPASPEVTRDAPTPQGVGAEIRTLLLSLRERAGLDNAGENAALLASALDGAGICWTSPGEMAPACGCESPSETRRSVALALGVAAACVDRRIVQRAFERESRERVGASTAESYRRKIGDANRWLEEVLDEHMSALGRSSHGLRSRPCADCGKRPGIRWRTAAEREWVCGCKDSARSSAAERLARAWDAMENGRFDHVAEGPAELSREYMALEKELGDALAAWRDVTR